MSRVSSLMIAARGLRQLYYAGRVTLCQFIYSADDLLLADDIR